MKRLAQFLGAGLAAMALGVAGAQADPPGAEQESWPLRGEVRGEVKIAALADLGLGWRVEAGAGGLRLSAARPGVELELALRMESGGGWRWTVRRGALDVAELWPLVRGKLGAAAAGWSASGRIELAGEGTWTPAGGPKGELRVELREGWARSDELEAEVSGVELDVKGSDLVGGTLAREQTLRIGRVAVAGADVERVVLKFGLDAAQVLEVAGGEAALLGGQVRLRPFRVPLSAPVVTAAADVEALQLGEAARLLPWLLQTAQGKLRGRVELSWDGEKGLRLRDGGLQIVRSDDAVFRLTPSPGLLTGEMPKKFGILPWKWARGLGFTNPAHAPLRDIEMGREGLSIEEFQVEFWPDGPGKGRTATIHIVGRPTGGKLVEEVKLDLNFHGPWSEFLAFGLNNDLSGFSFRLE